MSEKSLVITPSLRATLRHPDADGRGNYGHMTLMIREDSVCGDVAVEAVLRKKDIGRLIAFLRKYESEVVDR